MVQSTISDPPAVRTELLMLEMMMISDGNDGFGYTIQYLVEKHFSKAYSNEWCIHGKRHILSENSHVCLLCAR